jgi:group I intron endonuclease
MTINKETWILYQTTNLVNGKIYVGVHKVKNTSKSRTYLGSGLALKKAIKNHGRENFVRTTLAEFSCGKDAYAAEETMVTKQFISREDTYNMKIGGMGCKGLPLTEAHKAKISAGLKEWEKNLTKEDKAKIKAAHMGHIVSEKTIAKIVAFHKGSKRSSEARARMSAAQKGKVLTVETKRRISASHARSTPLFVRDKYYASIIEAAIGEKTHHATVQYRLRNNAPQWSEWRVATKEEVASFSVMEVEAVQNSLCIFEHHTLS